MCGIIGIIGQAPVTPLLVDALKRLEYRGYDSAGVATLVNGHIERRRAEGKLVNLEARLGGGAIPGHIGIMETFRERRAALLPEARRFESDTDTEVVAQPLPPHLERQLSPEEA